MPPYRYSSPTPSSSGYSGSLLHKRKNDLVEIAQALGLPDDPEARIADLVKSIQGYLEGNEAELSKNAQFKGLYKKRNSTIPPDSDSESPSAEIKSTINSTVKAGRKSLNNAVSRVQSVVDAANIPLPESPLAVGRISDVANTATENVSKALVPAVNVSRDLTTRLQGVSNQLVKYTAPGQRRVDIALRHLRDRVSTPRNLIISALSIELLFLLSHVVQAYNHTYYFPPPAGEKGTIASLLHIGFFWFPTVSWTTRYPELRGFGPSSDLWPAIAWWFFSTVLPPFALSTVISFVPQHGVARQGGPKTRYQESHPPIPTADPLTFALIRLAVLLLPLTSAAPSSLVDALELSGDAQGRALGAGLTAALVLAEKLA